MNKYRSKVKKLLEWLLDHHQEDRRVTVGYKDCNQIHYLMASTALTSWFSNHNDSHQVWIKNPFRK